jgi:hypothetical protein
MSVRSLIPRAPAQTSRPLASIATLSTIANPRLVFSSPHKDEVSLARRTMLWECPCTLWGASSGGEVAMMTPRVMVVLTAACGPQPGQHQDSNEGRHHRTLAVEEEGTTCALPPSPTLADCPRSLASQADALQKRFRVILAKIDVVRDLYC